jgi:hypothetical protein
MSFKNPLFYLIVVCFLFIAGCSGGNVVTPDTQENKVSNLPSTSDAGGLSTLTGIMGVYDLDLNIDNMTADLTPLRSSSVGEDFIVSGLGYWIMAPCTNCLFVDAIQPDGDAIKVTFDCSHPFDKGNPTQPPTGKNRLDLDVFDLALVIVPQALTPDDYDLTNAAAYAEFCSNADGYTVELANLTFDPAAVPYFLVIDDSIGGTSTFNKFEMGTDNELFDTWFNQGGKFRMYLTMGYGASATFTQRLNPKYFNPEFNRKPAWKVDVIPPNGDDVPDRTNTWNNLDTTTEYTVTVEVYDWQQGATVYGTPADFANAPATNLYAASEVEEVSLEIPGMHSTLLTATTPGSGTGTPSSPMVFEFSLANENGLDPGTYLGMVKVTDERAPLQFVDMRDFLVHSPNGLQRDNYEIPEYATYQIFGAVVVQGCGPITGSITNPATCPLTGVYDDTSRSFTASASSANGGDPIVLYEWDMDYDGTTFDVDGTGATCVLGPFDNPNCGTPPEDPVTYVVAVRATDSCDPANVQILGTCDVVVDQCATENVIPEFPVDTPTDDTWYDIAVMPDGLVYVVAEVTATSNTGMARTIVQYQNDGSSPVVIEPGTGIADIWANGFDTAFNRIDVNEAGLVGYNPQQHAFAAVSISGTDATDALGGAFAVTCGTWVNGTAGMADVWNQNTTAVTDTVGAYEMITDCADPYDAVIYYDPAATPDPIAFVVINPLLYEFTSVVGINGLEDTNNAVYFVSDVTLGYLSISGPWFGSGTPTQIQTVGTHGTNDQEFQGGLDVATDSANNILTLEDHGGSVYRFQKFSSDLTWLWSASWIGTGAPQRMDFDRADDKLYLLTDENFTICTVL